jgi:leader peptidase (prepilin peptidase)/N-methyltransferase
VTAAASFVLSGLLAWMMAAHHCQEIPEVRPTALWATGRVFYHAILMTILVVITATDLASYSIPTFALRWGTGIAVLGTVVAGDLQICHVWSDWNEAIDQIRGPYLPEWIKRHQHLHGLAWSVAGYVVGGGVVALVRALSSFVLGEPAMGSGDIGLMAMIGAFLGWQAAVVAFMLSPMLAIAGAVAVQFTRTRRFLPFGPFLAGGAIVVMFFWKSIWMLEFSLAQTTARDDRLSTFALRRLFGDPLSLAGLLGAVLGGTMLLLGLLRLYRMLPIGKPAE